MQALKVLGIQGFTEGFRKTKTLAASPTEGFEHVKGYAGSDAGKWISSQVGVVPRKLHASQGAEFNMFNRSCERRRSDVDTKLGKRLF